MRCAGDFEQKSLLRQAHTGDLASLLVLNEAAVPHVNHLTLRDMESFLEQAAYFRLLCIDGDPAAFLLGFAPGARYRSSNYRWFCQRYTSFIYIDRVAVAPPLRGHGLGGTLYRDLEAFAAPAVPLLACEVNLQPPNPGSIRFHQRFGFFQVGIQNTEGGKKTVSLMIKNIAELA